MALRKRVFRMLREHLWRYIGVFFLILLSCLTYVLVTGLTTNLDSLAGDFAEKNVQEDLYFSVSGGEVKLEQAEEEANAIIEGYPSVDVSLSDAVTLRLFGQTERVNVPAIIEGRGLQSSGEILLDPAFARSNGYPLGGTIEMGGQSFAVVGYTALPQYIYPLQGVNDLLAVPASFGISVISREDFRYFEGTEQNYSVRFRDRAASLNEQAMQLRAYLQGEGLAVSDWIAADNNKRMALVETSVTSYQAMSLPLSLSMILLSCLIVGIMTWRMIKREGVVIGTLYAFGYRRRELVRHYMALPMLLALAGGVSGALLGVPCVKPSVDVMVQSYLIPVPKIVFNPVDIFVSIIMPVAALGISSFFVVNSVLKHPAAELMKGNQGSGRVGRLERLFKLERLRFSTKFKLREQLRSVSRLLFLILGVASASALIMFGFFIISSYTELFKSSTESDYGFEYEYAYRSIQTAEKPAGTEGFNNGRFYPANDESIEFYVIAVEPDSEFLTIRDGGDALLPNSQTNMTSALADRLGVKAGDTLSFVSKQDGREYAFHVDAIATSNIQGIYMPLSDFNALLGYPDGGYIGLWSNESLDIPQQELAGAKAMSELSGSIDEMLGPLIGAMGAIILVACVVALIILYIVTSLLIEENRRTISLLKVFGYKGREVKSLILNSSTFVVVFGFIISIPIVFAGMGTLFDYIGRMINIVLPKTINPIFILACFVLILATYQLSKAICARSVSSVSMSEALKAGSE